MTKKVEHKVVTEKSYLGAGLAFIFISVAGATFYVMVDRTLPGESIIKDIGKIGTIIIPLVVYFTHPVSRPTEYESVEHVIVEEDDDSD